MRKALVTFESIVLAIGVFLSFMGTMSAVRLSVKYLPFFLITVLGIAFIVVLNNRKEEKGAALIGLGLIVIYIFAAGIGFAVCSIGARKIEKARHDARQSVTETRFENIEQPSEG